MLHRSASGAQQGLPITLQQRMQQALTADLSARGSPGNPQSAGGVGQPQAGFSGTAAGGAEQQDTGFWDLVYILYADFAEAAGVAMLRGLVPHWGLMEKTLMVRPIPVNAGGVLAVDSVIPSV